MKKTTPYERCLVIPVYNEEHRLAGTLNQLCTFFDSCEESYQIILVVNNSRDKSEEIGNKFAQKYPFITVLNFPQKIGKGGAIARGMKVAKAKCIGFTDADLSVSPQDIHRIFDTCEQSEYDVVIASRRTKNSIVENRSIARSTGSAIFAGIVNILFFLGIADTQCGTKVMKYNAIHDVIDQLTVSNFAFDVNLLIELKNNNKSIYEYPVTWVDDKGSSINNYFRTGYVMFLSILRLFLLYSPLKFLYPMLHPFGLRIWKIILTEEEVKYRKIWKEVSV